MNKTYDETEMNSRQRQRIVTTREPTALKYRSKRKLPVEPRMTKQQTRLSLAPSN